MTPDEASTLLVFANQIDPLVSVNDANADVWWAALGRQEFAKAKWCITDYYANTAPGRDGRIPALTPGVLRHRIGDKAQVVVSQQRALDPPRPVRHPNSWRERNPDEWDRLVAQGQDAHRQDLRRRGITTHPAKCPTACLDCGAA